MLKGRLRKLGLVLAIIVVVVAASVLLAPGRRTEANAASLSVLHGALDAQRSGQSAYEAASDGDLFTSGDALRADDAGNAVLNFFDGSTLTVESGTQVKVVSLSPAGGIHAAIEQGIGRTWASVVKLSTGSSFEIRTPTATAAVRGTAFQTIVENVGGTIVTTIRTTEGTVLVTAVAGGTVIVTAGNEVQIAAGATAPANASPQGTAPRLRFSAPANIGFTVIDPRGFQCGAAARQIPGCDTATGAVTIARPVAGTYLLALTAAAPASGNLTLEGGRGETTDFVARFVADLAAGDLVRTTVGVAVPLTGALSTTGFTAAQRLSSICGAEATGTIFSAGGFDERTNALRSFARANPGKPVAIVLSNAEVSAVMRDNAAGADLPVTFSGLSAGVARSGVNVSGQVAAGPLNLDGSVSLVASTKAGRVTVRVRDMDFGFVPVPDLVRDQIDAALLGMTDYLASLGIAVDRVAFREGCVALIGTAR
jgi:hypothetical protein